MRARVSVQLHPVSSLGLGLGTTSLQGGPDEQRAQELQLALDGEQLRLAALLRAVEGFVGSLEERVGVLAFGELGDAARESQPFDRPDRRARRRLPRSARRAARPDGLPPPGGRSRTRRRRRGTRCRTRAEPRAGATPSRRALPSPVEMTDALVDRLEVVDVEDEQGEAAAVAMRARALAQERLVEEPPVAKAGQRVECPRAGAPPGSGTRCRAPGRRGARSRRRPRRAARPRSRRRAGDRR